MKHEKTMFAKRLTAIRRRKGLTQPELAQKLGVSLEMVKYYETRAGSPNADTLLKIGGALNVDIEELISDRRASKRPGPESDLERCFDKVARLSKRRQRKILAVIDTLVEA